MKQIIFSLFFSIALIAQSAQNFDLQKLKWLTGNWRGNTSSGLVDEVWSIPIGNSMTGMFRIIKYDKIVLSQMQMITIENNQLILKLRHFNSDFKSWETKNEWVSFPIEKVSYGNILFKGMRYSLDEKGQLVVKMFTTGKDGKVNNQEVKMRKLDLNHSAENTNIKIYGVKIKISDMDQALSFYHNKMGFEISNRNNYPNQVELKNDSELKLFLSLSKDKYQHSENNEERVSVTFQSNNLLQTIKNLKAKDVNFLSIDPFIVGVGIAIKFRDPFGNVHSILEEQVGKKTEFKEPRIYNVGFSNKNWETLREFYCDIIGFNVRTEYYFPAIPIGNPDGSFAFMLHQNNKLLNSKVDYYKDSQTIIMFSTDNIQKSIQFFKQKDIPVLKANTQTNQNEKLIAFKNPIGLVSELIEIKH